MKIILAAGGSGGHIFPSIAVAREIGKSKKNEIHFVSSKRRLDKNILKDSGFQCSFLSVNPMPLKFDPIRTVVFAAKFFIDVIASTGLLIRMRPDVVVGFGGYSTGAIIAMAKIFNVPVLIHEQNLVPGRANRVLSRIAARVAISFRESVKYFQRVEEKVVYSGNPLRHDVLGRDRGQALKDLGLSFEKLTVLVMGGSQGSSFLNGTASEAARRVNKKMDGDIQFIHLTGKNDYEMVKRFYEQNGISGRVFSFLDRIEDAYAASDLAISRSGAAALFELACYSRAMILVPYPNKKNNQRYNAKYFSDAGAAIFREEGELSGEDLARDILEVLTDDQKRASISIAAGKLGVPAAGKRLAEEIIKLGVKRVNG